MIHSLSSMIGDRNTQASMPDGTWARAVPMPFRGGLFDRLRDAWAVLTEQAYAVQWPVPGELEYALGPAQAAPRAESTIPEANRTEIGMLAAICEEAERQVRSAGYWNANNPDAAARAAQAAHYAELRVEAGKARSKLEAAIARASKA